MRNYYTDSKSIRSQGIIIRSGRRRSRVRSSPVVVTSRVVLSPWPYISNQINVKDETTITQSSQHKDHQHERNTTTMVALKAIANTYRRTSPSGRSWIQKYCFSTVAPKKEKADRFVYADGAPPGYDGSAVVYGEVITEEEESTILLDLKRLFQRYVDHTETKANNEANNEANNDVSY